MFKEVSEVCLVQADGGLPTPVAAGSAPGESGVFVSSLRFLGGLHVSATPRRHQIFFQLNPQARFDCHIAGKPLQHQRIAGSYAIAPAGADYAADAEGSVDAILVAIEPGQFALAAAEGAAIETQLIERLNGFDQALCDSARRLALECANGYPNGALFWNASLTVCLLVILPISKAGCAAGWTRICCVVSGTMSLPIWMNPSRLKPWLKSPAAAHSTSRVCLPDRSGPLLTATSCTCVCGARLSLYARAVAALLKSQPLPALPTRVICRAGCGASTAFRRRRLQTDRQNSRNLHDPSLRSP